MGLDMAINVDGKETIYMRKANAIRKWFAENLDDFNDNGRTSISREKFKEIIDLMFKIIYKGGICNLYDCYTDLSFDGFEYICKRFVEDGGKNYENFHKIAAEQFPTSSGFFFGSTDYDENYLEDLISYYDKFKKLYMKLTDNDTKNWEEYVEYIEWY